MDRVGKALQKLSAKERKQVKKVVETLQSGRFGNLDIKKLKGTENIFRARKGDIRIIYQTRNGRVFILKIARRNEKTYKL